jgi:hypothetical protein
MTDNLLLAGRCRYPRKLEADLWAREAVFSTGLGFSFAIPHSKSEHIEQSTISVARLAQPVAWGDEEAQFVIMLTLNKHSAGISICAFSHGWRGALCTRSSVRRWYPQRAARLSRRCSSVSWSFKP